MKSCSKCKELKPLTQFSKDKNNSSGYKSQCKACVKVYYKNKLDTIRKKQKEYYQKNADILKNKSKNHYLDIADNRKEQMKEYYQNNKEKLTAYQIEYNTNNRHKRKEYLIANKEKLLAQQNQYTKTRRANDPLFKLKFNTRNLIRISIKNNGYSKQSKTNQILGCSYEQFKQHIEQQFTEGMNWDNRQLWHLDHIIPVSLGLTEEEILALNHYTNFQPLWAEDNLAKSNNIHWQKCTQKYKQ